MNQAKLVVNSQIFRANRGGADIGTSPGICPITPYTGAALDYRASWIAGDMVKHTKVQTPNQKSHLWAEMLTNEARSNMKPKPQLDRGNLPPNPNHTKYRESNGLERSLATNIPDHPTAIQVNGLRQERTEGSLCPGYIAGVGTYDARTLTGNWSEERCDKKYRPSDHNQSRKNEWAYVTSTQEQAREVTKQHKCLPERGSSAVTPYTHPESSLSTGHAEASTMSNSETVRLGGIPHVDYIPGDARSASRPFGNYVNYQTGMQALLHCVGGQRTAIQPYETSTQAAFSDPDMKRTLVSAGRCDLRDVGKPHFQLRDPARDSKAKMLCSIKRDEFACLRDDMEQLSRHKLGFPVANKQKVYTLDEYRARWTKSAPIIAEANAIPCSEQRGKYQPHNLDYVEDTKRRPGHIGAWH